MSDGVGPGGLMPKIIAAMLDVFGLGCSFLCISGDADMGLSLSCIPDILGVSFLGGPVLFKRGPHLRKTKKRFLLFALGEFLPGLGDVFPFWSISTWRRKK